VTDPSDLAVQPLPGYPPLLGAALWGLEDARRRTLEALDGLDLGMVDKQPPGLANTIGSLLYHIAAIEADWLYADILGVDYPVWMEDTFPVDVREEDGRLTPVTGESLDDHLQRMALVRQRFLADLRPVTDDDFVRVRQTPSGMVSPQWVLHHLGQHEAEHRGQLQSAVTVLEGTT
jgi:uncharacterized damage-inducible protein DinB